MNYVLSLEADLHSKIGDNSEIRQIQIKDGTMHLSIWIEQNRCDQSVGTSKQQSGTYGIAHQ